MRAVLRRWFAVLFFVFVLAACGGANRVAVDAGDESLTRDQLVSLATALRNTPEQEMATISAEDLRQVSTFYLVSAAYFDYLDDQGVEVPDSVRSARADFISDQINAGMVGEIEFESPQYFAYLDILMVADVLELFPLSQAEFLEILNEYTSDFEVESRLGTWDSSTATITAP